MSFSEKVLICDQVDAVLNDLDEYAVSDHVGAILDHADNKKIVDAVLVNNS